MKQTDYDKALMECKSALENPYRTLTTRQMLMIEQAFRKGYEYGKISQNIANCDIDHFRDDTKMLRAEIAKDIFTRCLAHEDGDVRAFCSRNMQMHARECVEAADALIAELGI